MIFSFRSLAALILCLPMAAAAQIVALGALREAPLAVYRLREGLLVSGPMGEMPGLRGKVARRHWA